MDKELYYTKQKYIYKSEILDVMTKFYKIILKYFYFDVQRELGGGARLLYNLNVMDIIIFFTILIPRKIKFHVSILGCCGT